MMMTQLEKVKSLVEIGGLVITALSAIGGLILQIFQNSKAKKYRTQAEKSKGEFFMLGNDIK